MRQAGHKPGQETGGDILIRPPLIEIGDRFCRLTVIADEGTDKRSHYCIICGEKFKLQVRDKHDRKICHSPECRDIWQKYRKSVIDYNRGKRKNEPAIQEFIEKYRKGENNGDK